MTTTALFELPCYYDFNCESLNMYASWSILVRATKLFSKPNVWSWHGKTRGAPPTAGRVRVCLDFFFVTLFCVKAKESKNLLPYSRSLELRFTQLNQRTLYEKGKSVLTVLASPLIADDALE